MIGDDLSDDATGEQGTENTRGGQDRQAGQD
jgi:hypothetical protein